MRFFSGKLFYKSNRKLFSCVCIAWYKHSRRWENSRQLGKPSTSSRVCITVSNSPNPSSVYIRLCKDRKKVFCCFYKITFPRKNAKLFVIGLIKREIFTSRKILYTTSCTRNQFLFCKKMLFKIRILTTTTTTNFIENWKITNYITFPPSLKLSA